MSIPSSGLFDRSEIRRIDSLARGLSREMSWGIDLSKVGMGRGALTALAMGDMLIHMAECCFETTVHGASEIDEDLLMVRGAINSGVAYQANGQSTWSFRRPEVTVLALPRGTRLSVRLEGGVQQRLVTVLFSPRALVERHGVAMSELPAPLAALIEGRLEAPHTLVSLPIDVDMTSLVRDLLGSRLEGSLRRMQVQARAAELLALVVAAWRDHLAVGQCLGVRWRDVEFLIAARRILAEQFADPPAMAELASRLGTNKNKLNRLFQSQLKTTPQAYCLKLRIERAQALIAQGRMSLGQVASEVGYEHQSSFATAFRLVAGMSPRQYAEACRHGGDGASMVH